MIQETEFCIRSDNIVLENSIQAAYIHIKDQKIHKIILDIPENEFHINKLKNIKKQPQNNINFQHQNNNIINQQSQDNSSSNENIKFIDYYKRFVFPGIIDTNFYTFANFTYQDADLQQQQLDKKNDEQQQQWSDINRITKSALMGGVTTIINQPLLSDMHDSNISDDCDLQEQFKNQKIDQKPLKYQEKLNQLFKNSFTDFAQLALLQPSQIQRTKSCNQEIIQNIDKIVGLKIYLIQPLQYGLEYFQKPEQLLETIKKISNQIPENQNNQNEKIKNIEKLNNLPLFIHTSRQKGAKDIQITSPLRNQQINSRLQYISETLDQGIQGDAIVGETGDEKNNTKNDYYYFFPKKQNNSNNVLQNKEEIKFKKQFYTSALENTEEKTETLLSQQELKKYGNQSENNKNNNNLYDEDEEEEEEKQQKQKELEETMDPILSIQDQDDNLISTYDMMIFPELNDDKEHEKNILTNQLNNIDQQLQQYKQSQQQLKKQQSYQYNNNNNIKKSHFEEFEQQQQKELNTSIENLQLVSNKSIQSQNNIGNSPIKSHKLYNNNTNNNNLNNNNGTNNNSKESPTVLNIISEIDEKEFKQQTTGEMKNSLLESQQQDNNHMNINNSQFQLNSQKEFKLDSIEDNIQSSLQQQNINSTGKQKQRPQKLIIMQGDVDSDQNFDSMDEASSGGSKEYPEFEYTATDNKDEIHNNNQQQQKKLYFKKNDQQNQQQQQQQGMMEQTPVNTARLQNLQQIQGIQGDDCSPESSLNNTFVGVNHSSGNNILINFPEISDQSQNNNNNQQNSNQTQQIKLNIGSYLQVRSDKQNSGSNYNANSNPNFVEIRQKEASFSSLRNVQLGNPLLNQSGDLRRRSTSSLFERRMRNNSSQSQISIDQQQPNLDDQVRNKNKSIKRMQQLSQQEKIFKEEAESNDNYDNFLTFRPPYFEHFAINFMRSLLLLDNQNNNSTTNKDTNNQIKNRNIVFQNVANALSVVKIESLKNLQRKLNNQQFSDKVNIFCEVSSPYLEFDSTIISKHERGSIFKNEPPIQDKMNKKLLISALYHQENMIDLIGSFNLQVPSQYKIHHCDKFKRSFNGFFSAGTNLQQVWTVSWINIKKQVSEQNYNSMQNTSNHDEIGQYQKKLLEQKMLKIADKLCTKPAEILNIQNKKGAIKVGNDADFIVWDPYTVREFSVKELYHLSNDQLNNNNKYNNNNPYQYVYNEHLYYHRKLYGVIWNTFIRGQEVFKRQDQSIKFSNSFKPNLITQNGSYSK